MCGHGTHNRDTGYFIWTNTFFSQNISLTFIVSIGYTPVFLSAITLMLLMMSLMMSVKDQTHQRVKYLIALMNEVHSVLSN